MSAGPGLLLALNAGSSSMKMALFSSEADLPELLRGEVSGLGEQPHVSAHDAQGACIADGDLAPGNSAEAAGITAILALVDTVAGDRRLAGIGHRIVHGGGDHVAPERVTPALMAALAALTPLDPMHMPHNLAPIRALATARPDVPQFVCFDTAFHHTMPAVARAFALPHAISEAGVRRYGFHGLSCEYIAATLVRDAPALADGRTIVAHLGAGASLCALAGGRSVASTMGISVLDGLMMATRCGSLDPGAIFYLGRLGHGLADIEDMLYHQSGLLGVSGISGDMRVLLASDDPRARAAIDLYVYRIVSEIGALAAALGGLDGIVFTAGVGTYAPDIRAAVCAKLTWLGLRLDDAANAAGATKISTAISAIDVRVIATNEEAVIAGHVRAGLRAEG